ncbi:MAG TPA: four helix bundle protein [Gemmatimonadales bacterium]
MQPFEKLAAWQACHRLTLHVYRITRNFPTEERYGLTAQIRRGSVSAASNIAEGSAKRGRKEFRRYLDNARGSLSELGCLFILCKDLGLLSADDVTLLDCERNRAGALTWKLLRAMTDNP